MEHSDPYWQGQAHPGQASLAAEPFAASRRVQSARRNRRWWVAALWVLGTAVLALAAVTVGVSLHNTGRGGATTAGSASGNGATASPPHAGTTSPSTTGAPGTPGGPTITSLTPNEGAAGQTVVIAGSGLMSSDGQVVARFGGVVAPTSCPSVSSCTATAPPAPAGTAQVPVTVSTAGGTSNSLSFTYH